MTSLFVRHITKVENLLVKNVATERIIDDVTGRKPQSVVVRSKKCWGEDRRAVSAMLYTRVSKISPERTEYTSFA